MSVRRDHLDHHLEALCMPKDPDDFDVGFDGSSDDAADEAEDFRPTGGNEDDAESTTRQVCA